MQELTRTPRTDASRVLTVACPPPARMRRSGIFRQRRAASLTKAWPRPSCFPTAAPAPFCGACVTGTSWPRAGIPRNNLSEMENGKRPIGRQMARKPANALNTDPRMFLSV